MEKFPEPKSVTEIRGFLGLCNYYRKLVRDFSEIARPLTDATKKGQAGFACLNAEQKLAFTQLKEFLASAPVLQLVDPDKTFVLQTDASAFAIGGVLMQPGHNGELHPCGYFSRKLTDAQQRYTVTQRELLGIVESLRYWRTELVHAPDVIVHCDHRPLSFLRTVEPLGDMHARWLAEMEQFQFSVVHRPGSTMGPADALSRRSDWADASTGGATLKGRTVPLPTDPADFPAAMEISERRRFNDLPPMTASPLVQAALTLETISLGPDLEVSGHERDNDQRDLDVHLASLVAAMTTRGRSAAAPAGGKQTRVSDARKVNPPDAADAANASDHLARLGDKNEPWNEEDLRAVDNAVDRVLRATIAKQNDAIDAIRKATQTDLFVTARSGQARSRRAHNAAWDRVPRPSSAVPPRSTCPRHPAAWSWRLSTTQPTRDT